MAWGDNTKDTDGKGPWGNLPQGGKKPSQPSGNSNGSFGGPNKPASGGGGNKNNSRFDFEKLFKNNNNGEFNISVRGLIALLIVALIGWSLTGFYKVDASEVGVVLRFGKFHRYEPEGLRYHLPTPIEQVAIVKRTVINTIEIGFRGNGNSVAPYQSNYNGFQGVSETNSSESLMITGDTNIADVSFAVQWRIKDPKDFLFNLDKPEATIKSVSESAMREVVGRSLFAEAMTTKRAQIEDEVQDIIQKILDSYGSGVEIYAVNLNDVQNPKPVMPAFLDVETAKQDKETLINQARSYENDIIPKARGNAQKAVQEAEAYKEQVISVAKGEASRFASVYAEYAKAKDITKQRIYLETMQHILAGKNKIIIDNNGGVVPYMPVNDMLKNIKNNK